MTFFSGNSNNGQYAPRRSGLKLGFGSFVNNVVDKNNDNNRSVVDYARTGLGLLSPTGWMSNLFTGIKNQYKDSQKLSYLTGGHMPALPGISGQYSPYDGQPQSADQYLSNHGVIGDLTQNMNIPQYGLGGNDRQYTGGSATFNERTGNYATPPQGNNFLSGYNPTANQYRGIQMNQQRNDNMAGYLNSANGANPFAHMNPGDMALSNHNSHTQYMDSQRFMGDMNPYAQAEFNDQNKARYEAAMMSK